MSEIIGCCIHTGIIYLYDHVTKLIPLMFNSSLVNAEKNVFYPSFNEQSQPGSLVAGFPVPFCAKWKL